MNENTPPNQPLSSIVALEEKLMFQQQSLDELNSVVLQQQSEIDRLTRELQTLRTSVQQFIENGDEDLPHEKPPHY